MFRLTPDRLRHTLLILFPLLLPGWCTAAAPQPVRDTLYTLEQVYRLAGKDGELAGLILDSLERQRTPEATIPQHRITTARAFVASRELNPRLALRYLRRIIDTEELRNDPQTDLKATALMCNEYEVLNQRDEALRYTLILLDKARKHKNPIREAAALLYLGDVYSREGEEGKGLQQIDLAQQILRKLSGESASDYLLWSIELEAEAYARMGDYPRAIRITHELIDRFDERGRNQQGGTDDQRDETLNFRQAQNRISLARLYALHGQSTTAAEVYAQAQQLLARSDKPLSPQMHELTFDYLRAAERYPEALREARQYLAEANIGDTINRYTHTAKRQLSEALFHMGDYPAAWHFERQASALADSLHERANYETALELEAVYQSGEQQAQILRQQTTILRIREIARALLLGVASLGIILFLLWWKGRQIGRKNRQLFERITQLGDAQRELDRIRHALNERHLTGLQLPGTATSTTASNPLLEGLERLMLHEQRFRDPNLTREQVAAELGTNKLYLSNAITAHYGTTFLEYINRLRLEYAKTTLLSDHKTKIEAIALSSGFNSVRTFYRLFQKHYSLTPSEFRHISATYQNQSPTN